MTDQEKVLWELSESVEAGVSRPFAWSFWTNVANWSEPPTSFALEGPFRSGARGTTLVPGEPPRHWFLREVRPPEHALIEMPLERATVHFDWRFEALGDFRTRITQTVALRAADVDPSLLGARELFLTTLPAGMQRVAAAISTAFARDTSQGSG
jgi:hypothetical protein